MIRTPFLFGLSTLACAAGLASPASAQNSQSGNCVPAADNGVVTPNGNQCTLSRAPTGTENRAAINVTGTANLAFVQQDGVFSTSTLTVVGDGNNVQHIQTGHLLDAGTTIAGDENVVAIAQAMNRQRVAITLTGSRNFFLIGQSDGSNNSVISTARGNNIGATILQQDFGFGAPALDNVARLDLANNQAPDALGNLAQQIGIFQGANGDVAQVVVRGGTTATARGQTLVAVRQGNPLYRGNADGSDLVAGPPDAANNPATRNLADVSIAGDGQNVAITQFGARNTSIVSMSRGGSRITPPGGGIQDGLTFDGNRPEGNALEIEQVGRDNNLRVSIGGRDAAGFNGRGNLAFISQGGTPPQPLPPSGCGCAPSPETNPAAFATADPDALVRHSATLYQFSTLSTVLILQGSNISDSGAGVNAGGFQYASIADVSQSAFASIITLDQLGTNFAFITQGGSAADVGDNLSGNNLLEVSQVDAGDNLVGGAGSGGPFNPPASFTPARNSLIASQAGRFNAMTVRQNGINGSATLWQRRGSIGATVELNQGSAQGFGEADAPGPVAGASSNLAATVEQGGSETAGGRIVAIEVRQAGANLTANAIQNSANFSTATGTSIGISQIGQRNSASVVQTGSNAIATVDQRGGNAVAGDTRSNLVTVTQSGGAFGAGGAADAGNRAIVRQFATAGVSASDAGSTQIPGEGSGLRAGSQPAEAVIIQTVSGAALDMNSVNSALIEQSGRGQYAEIAQNGRGNLAAIRQGAAATNSVAIIRQNGSENVFYVEQTAANQFYRVVQSGTANQIVTSTNLAGGAPPAIIPFAPAPGPIATGGF